MRLKKRYADLCYAVDKAILTQSADERVSRGMAGHKDNNGRYGWVAGSHMSLTYICGPWKFVKKRVVQHAQDRSRQRHGSRAEQHRQAIRHMKSIEKCRSSY